MEENQTKKEDVEMLVATYNFSATIPQTMSFCKDDTFIFHSTNNIKKKWWSIINSQGKTGYIPSNYVSLIKVEKSTFVDFVDSALEALCSEISKDGGTNKQQELVKELKLRRQDFSHRRSRSKDRSDKKEKLSCSKSLPNSESIPDSKDGDYEKNDHFPVTAPLVMRVSMSENKFPSIGEPSSSESSQKMTAPSPPESNSSGNIADPQPIASCETLLKPKEQNRNSKTSQIESISPQTVYLLIHQVRNQTLLSHEESRIAAGVVAEGLLDILPQTALPGLETFLEVLHANVPPPERTYDETLDYIELQKILSHLRTAREDAQQRSWHLWDDEETIRKNISLLSSILSNADPAISRRVLRQNNYDDITMLVDYYQMEERMCIRQLLIQAFAVLCSLDKLVISLLLNSVLPMELAREMQSNRSNPQIIEKPAMLLAMIFSLGEAMPITHLDLLGKDFITTILQVIESDCETESEDIMVTLILSYNLQFKPKSTTNITLQALTEMESAKIFTEKVMLLINREDDPIEKLKVHDTPHHSVLKLLKDVFVSPTTAQFFYTNDIKVLVDIIVRQVTDQPPNTRRRSEYLELCRLVLFSCEEATFEHRISDLKNLFNYIVHEEQPPVPQDKQIVHQIVEGLPQHFG